MTARLPFRVQCGHCKKDVAVTQQGELRVHGPRHRRCIGSGTNLTSEMFRKIR
jgi:hypothetical protein